MLQVLEACRAERQLQDVQQAQRQHPSWLAEAEGPVVFGGGAAVVCAYAISMYTIYHVARAYKKLELKVRLPPPLMRVDSFQQHHVKPLHASSPSRSR